MVALGIQTTNGRRARALCAAYVADRAAADIAPALGLETAQERACLVNSILCFLRQGRVK